MVDYSKWGNIEISDDEDETHPNIDTPSLFRWRHQARVERMEDHKKEKDEFDSIRKKNLEQITQVQKQMENSKGDGFDFTELQARLDQLVGEETKLKMKEDELKAKERVTPWNVDTLSKAGFTKTVINKPGARQKEELSEEEREKRMQIFIKENEKVLKEFGMLRKYEDSRKFLLAHPQLVSEDTANYLVIWCINLEMEDKQMLSQHVAHQCICMQYILELSKQLEVDPRSCVATFFSKIQVAEPEYKASFEDELSGFKDRVRKRAKEKLEQALREQEEQEEEERQERLGPGGLDPVQVFETLPAILKECFEKQDIPLLQKTIGEMPQEEAAYHMKRCVDSGLWLPDAGKGKGTSTATDTTTPQEETVTETEKETGTETTELE